jgi:nucleotide-binding universal stress UspA family protein
MSIFPTRILLAADGSEDAAHATEVAVELSKTTSSELHVVYVGQDAYSATLVYPQATDSGGIEQEDPVVLEELEQQFEQIARRILDAEVEKVRAKGGTAVQAHLRIGNAATEIVDLAEKLSAGLIVVGSRGLSGIRRALIGSVSDSVVRHAHCPVLVVRKEERGE